MQVLSKDSVLAEIICNNSIQYRQSDDHSDIYYSLNRAITGQQLSVKAAATIFRRFIALFPNEQMHPEQVLNFSDDELSTVGLSKQKISYVKNIARYFKENEETVKSFHSWSDDEIIKELTSIKGVGKWTVQMLLMFTLNREDIFPLDDLGIQKSMIAHYGIEYSNKKDLKKQMESLANAWRPYRTIACLYLWEAKDKSPLSKDQ